MIIAHRGLHTQYPENSIAAFEAALDSGADAIETDLRLTRDGCLVVSHNDEIALNGRDIVISETDQAVFKDELLTGDELFAYIAASEAHFFLELKQDSSELFEAIVSLMSEYNLWDRVHLLGFEINLEAALAAQETYPKLKIVQIMTFGAHQAARNHGVGPAFKFSMAPDEYIRARPKSYGIAKGWLDGVSQSEELFKRYFTPENLASIQSFSASLGYRIFGGVPNTEAGARYFFDAGIRDIFTDRPDIVSGIL